MKTAHFSYDADKGWTDAPELDSPSTLLVVLGETHYGDHPDRFGELREKYPQSVIVGGSSSGGIFHGDFLGDTLAVAVVQFESTEVRVARTPQTDFGVSLQAGSTLGRELNDASTDEAPLRAVFVLANGIHTNGTDFLKGLNGEVGADVLVTGALAGDGDRFERTWIFDGTEPSFEQSVAVGLYGDKLVATHGCAGGWDIFGVKRRITRSDGNTLYELDGKPALEIYERFLGSYSRDLPASGLLFPLQIERDQADGGPIVRTILGIDREANAMQFAGDMPEGSTARFMKANHGRIVDGAEQAGVAAAEASHGPNPFALAVSCIGRRSVLQGYQRDELLSVERVLPDDTLMFGLYSYGELAPSKAGGQCELHNQTMTVTLFSEAE